MTPQDEQRCFTDIANAVASQWLTKRNKNYIQTDWLMFEDLLVLILKLESVPVDSKLRLIKEALDEFTRRGHFQSHEYYNAAKL